VRSGGKCDLTPAHRVLELCGDPERARSLVRSAFCKREEVIDEAAARLAPLRRPHPTA